MANQKYYFNTNPMLTLIFTLGNYNSFITAAHITKVLQHTTPTQKQETTSSQYLMITNMTTDSVIPEIHVPGYTSRYSLSSSRFGR